ncbi:Protein NUCLEAR FUSION DEFECTIVE 2 [Carex littledalei]|uniref:Protein NUCLEAR FUSION DEFECTIVE 2 n=1 Tax=Carex littledalei TaxID=544730 RepID=A0A833V8A8_9POAL|nr:Protein NUCLEAR FUSION DEFECTIVE 2 [Carex littledalei]
MPLLLPLRLALTLLCFLLVFLDRNQAAYGSAIGSSSSSFSAALETLQNQIGYQFKTIDLLKQALTHPSYSQENNRALSILGLSSAESAASLRLLANNADASASSVSSAVAEASRLSTCATAGKRLGIGAIVRVASGTDASTPSVICTALRAVFGAVAVDTGSVDAAAKVFLTVYKSGLGVAVL